MTVNKPKLKCFASLVYVRGEAAAKSTLWRTLAVREESIDSLRKLITIEVTPLDAAVTVLIITREMADGPEFEALLRMNVES